MKTDPEEHARRRRHKAEDLLVARLLGHGGRLDTALIDIVAGPDGFSGPALHDMEFLHQRIDEVIATGLVFDSKT